MPTFPTLKTGAIVQYPATVQTSFQTTKVVEFLDGSSHRYSSGAAPLRQWIVRLERLDGREQALVDSFVRNNVEGAFAFTDPFSGAAVPKCVLQGPEMRNTITGELNQETSLVIEELP